jgi:hypothetical protein
LANSLFPCFSAEDKINVGSIDHRKIRTENSENSSLAPYSSFLIPFLIPLGPLFLLIPFRCFRFDAWYHQAKGIGQTLRLFGFGSWAIRWRKPKLSDAVTGIRNY